MQVLIKKVVDPDKSTDIMQLPSWERFVAGITLAYRKTQVYQRKLQKQAEADYRYRVTQENFLKSTLLQELYNELVDSKTVSGFGTQAKEIYIAIDNRYVTYLDNVLRSKDLLSFKIERVPEDEDMRVAFPDMPVVLKCTRLII